MMSSKFYIIINQNFEKTKLYFKICIFFTIISKLKNCINYVICINTKNIYNILVIVTFFLQFMLAVHTYI